MYPPPNVIANQWSWRHQNHEPASIVTSSSILVVEEESSKFLSLHCISKETIIFFHVLYFQSSFIMEWLFGKKKTPEEMLKQNQRALNRAMRCAKMELLFRFSCDSYVVLSLYLFVKLPISLKLKQVWSVLNVFWFPSQRLMEELKSWRQVILYSWYLDWNRLWNFAKCIVNFHIAPVFKSCVFSTEHC